MDAIALRRRIARTSLATVAALPVRVSAVARRDARILALSARWLVTSREHTNFTYHLTPRNLAHLAWWTAGITGAGVEQTRGWIAEALEDTDLRDHVQRETARSARRRLADRDVRLGRRLGWYAIVRALRPEHVVETGTDKGLGSTVLAAALLRNGTGRLTTIDVNPDSGYLVAGRYAEVVDRVVGDSVETLQELTVPVDVFLHDSWHTFEYETAELDAVTPLLRPASVVLSDNAHDSDALSAWAGRTGRRFTFFREEPLEHWDPGAGIGAAWVPETGGLD